jgi:aarF domain-containing kinase
MSGRRLLDAIQILNVAKSVATKHLAVRQRQLDLFTRTSSLTKGIKEQADGLVLTAQAAAALAKRFNEPDSTPKAQTPSSTESPLPSQAEPRAANLSADEARKLQRQAESQIPATAAEYNGSEGLSNLNVSQQQDVFYQPSRKAGPELSGLPRTKLPKNASDIQSGLVDDINADVYHSPVDRGKASSPAQEQEVPDEVMNQLFRSPKAARSISRKVDVPQGVSSAFPTEQAEKEDIEMLANSIADDVVLTNSKVRSTMILEKKDTLTTSSSQTQW